MLTFTWWYLVEFCNFYPRLILETIFPVLTLTQRNYTNMKIYFLENWQLNRKLASPLLPLKVFFPREKLFPQWLTLEDSSRNLTSMKVSRIEHSNSPFSFMSWKTLRSSTRATFTNPNFQSFCVRKNVKVEPKIQI